MGKKDNMQHSINRKTTITWNDPSGNLTVDGTVAELNYNDQWLLTHVTYVYPSGYLIQASDYTSIDIVYDAQKVLQKITIKYGDGSITTRNYVKTMLSSGNYQLSWDETGPIGQGDRLLRRAIFNADGKNIINVFEHTYVATISGAGDTTFSNRITSDTIFYDASGSANKIVRNEIDTLLHTSETFVSYEFLSRQVKGQQLYNQRQAIMNGIANMSFGDSDSPEDAFSILAVVLDYEYLQYSKYPIQTAKMTNFNGNYNFTANSEFDNLNRLVKFKGFFLDIDITERVYKIKYYK